MFKLWHGARWMACLVTHGINRMALVRESVLHEASEVKHLRSITLLARSDWDTKCGYQGSLLCISRADKWGTRSQASTLFLRFDEAPSNATVAASACLFATVYKSRGYLVSFHQPAALQFWLRRSCVSALAENTLHAVTTP
jgi:hypothetical protein